LNVNKLNFLNFV